MTSTRPVFLLAVAGLAGCHAQTVVPLPMGETSLCDIGIYRVAYQSYGGQVVDMPPSWIGHFEPVAGISYLPSEHLLGRRAILLHSPWHIAPGRAFVDYPVKLPDAAPLTLSFGIAMRPDVVAPDKSDGVTFSAYVVDPAGEAELFRQHYNVGAWQGYSFDLGQYRGQTITIRLQVEPGPANSPSFDFSYWGDPKITCGSGAEGQRALLDELTSTRAYKATAGVDLTALANRGDQGVLPSNLLPFSNTLGREGDVWVLSYHAADADIVYRYEAKTGTFDDLTVAVDGGEPFQPAMGGGFTFVDQNELAKGGHAVEVTRVDEGVKVVWEYPGGERASWTLGIVGKAIRLTAAGTQPNIVAFSLGNVAGAPLRRALGIPYLPASWSQGQVTYLPSSQLYVSRYLDWTVSHSSQCPQGEASYEPKTDGTRNVLLESGYVAVSPCVDEVLPNIPHPASPYLDLLGPRIMLDIWGHHKGTYVGDAENLRELKDNGVDHVAIIQHVWQRWGYDVKLPDHIPADPRYGGDEGMAEFGRTANELGYVWSVHENYIDLYPDAPSYDETARVLRADGQPSPAWFNRGTGVQSYGLKCNRAKGYAEQNSPEIHRRYGTTAAYLDVHTCVPPWHQLDHEADQPMAAMELAKVKSDGELFQYMRDTHEGPLFGEGANQFYWAGLVDGTEAQVPGGEDHVPFLDYDLLHLHPQMVNHGMGYYERWYRRGYDHRDGMDTGTPEQVDKYRAQELAYGHAGFIGAAQIANLQWVAKEHHLMHAVQRLSGNSKVNAVDYGIDGRFVTGSVALAMDQRWRQRIRYQSGLTLYVNWAPEPWEVEGRTLPQWGWLATGPDTVACTVLQDGKFADWVDCPEYLFIDARTSFNMPYLRSAATVEPRLRSFKDLGDGKIEVTYEWLVGQGTKLDHDDTVFVHFTNDANPNPDHIEFQQDHQPPKPTSQWQAGETVVDGPYTINVPAEGQPTYDLLIGLYNGGRVSLKGHQAGGDRILLARLGVTRDGGKVTEVEQLELPPEEASLEADFTAHLNPAGTRVDFGAAATDGSAKIERGERRLTVLPYPREKAFALELDLRRILGDGVPDPAKVTVHALAALTQADLGAVPTEVRDGRLILEVGQPGAGRFVITW